jgi:hypothetical protein
MTVDGREVEAKVASVGGRGWSQEVAQAPAVHHPGYGLFVSLWVTASASAGLSCW